VISDCLQHDTSQYVFISTININYLKCTMPEITRVKYFSDGAAALYKNFENVIHHHEVVCVVYPEMTYDLTCDVIV